MGYYGLVLIKFIIGFFIVIMHLNLSGKTQLSQMTPVDFIGNFVLGGIIGGVIYSDSIPLQQYVLVLFIGVGLISLLNAITKHVNFFRAIAIGNPLPIVKKGRFIMDNILRKKNKIDILNIASQLHSQGINSFQQVTYAQIEPSGQLTVVCDNAKMPSVIIMKDGKVRQEELEQIEKDQEWLKGELNERSLKDEDIFIAEFWDGKVMFILRDGKIVR
ncbi:MULTISPECIES: DUF421 domain-containing protein [unclassified Brenneria]|uniref:DUF421 domain-containing protein n=1 Tax=unclassified Brenneria TaxID=2634434 RepID=UPI001556A0F7|nr:MULTISPECIES: YetF domain-containing protein [unclassified Brenneria]MBJ7221875.1 DUF421 domain-containing protein [Brenneria sp. L3-3C-1]MEE3643118.1 YetF domain-containing protein [Brenneria sp. L3_3C_1]MEE3650695.1 YetF domain-containing protein [Brenneria sp. HEZEL_4_2_4]NPD00650.1 DUF421 domain-containing protein [Brenneria sp. hezel4-2-4]